MIENPFKHSSDNDLKRIVGGKPKGLDLHSPDPKAKTTGDSLVNGKGGGGLGKANAAKKKTDEENDFWDKEEKRNQEKANSAPPDKPVDRTVVKIKNIAWDATSVIVGGTAILNMDVDIPPEHAHATKITCTLEQQMPAGNWKPITTEMQPCNAKDGKARCELTVPEPLKKDDGNPPQKFNLRPTLKHAYSSAVLGPPIEAVPGKDSPFDSVIFYSPLRKEYLCHDTEEEFKSILTEISKLEKLRDLTLKCMETKDQGARKKIQEEIEKETDELFETETIGDASAAFEELILIRRNKKWGNTKGSVFIRPYGKKNKTEIKGHWRKDSDATLKKNLDDLLKRAPGSKEHPPLFDSEFKAKLFETDPIQHHSFLWRTKPDPREKNGEPINFKPEAALCRFAMNITLAESSIDLKEKKFHLGSNGSISFGLLEGKVEGKYPWPEKGINLLTFLKKTTHLDAFIKKDRQCLLRLNVTLGAKGFLELTVAGALNLPDIDLSKEKVKGKKKESGSKDHKAGPHASLGAEAHGFAGARASAELSVSPEWARKDGDKFQSLGSCGVEGGVSAGLGGEAEWKIEYKSGTFHIKAGAGLTAGLGCKGSFSFELGVEEGFHFIGYLLHSVDYHYVVEIQAEAFKAYKNYTFTLMTLGHKVLTAETAMVVDVITDFGNWLTDIATDLKTVKKSLFESSVAQGTLSNVPPEALGQALITIMQTREPDDFKSILSILYSTMRPGANVKTDPSANHKLKWTLRAVSGIDIPDVDGPGIQSMKEDAIKKGIKVVRDFGYGVGYTDENGDPQKANLDFISKFQLFMKENGVY
jgi:hypothetical protein